MMVVVMVITETASTMSDLLVTFEDAGNDNRTYHCKQLLATCHALKPLQTMVTNMTKDITSSMVDIKFKNRSGCHL